MHRHESAVDPELMAFLDEVYAQGVMDFNEMSAQEARALFQGMEGPPPAPEVASVRDISIPSRGVEGRSIAGRLYHPAPGKELPLVVHFHGGGWVWGTLDGSENECRLIAAHGELAVLSVDYRLAPEHPFPAGLEDCVDATRWALAHASELGTDPAKVGVAGDSAGGNLAAAVALELRDASGLPHALAGQYLLFPVLGADFDTDSMRRYATSYLLEREHMEWFFDLYVPAGFARSDPRITPVHASSHARLPPAVIHLPELDVLRSDGEQYAAQLQAAGVPVDLRIAANMIHSFSSLWGVSAEARTEFEEGIRAFSDLLSTPHPNSNSD
jgi:acetyl esterase